MAINENINLYEDYVSFETAKLLKEKGFNEECIYVYRHNGSQDIWDADKEDIACQKPTLQMAIKWLREVHHWLIFVIPRWEDVEYVPGEWKEEMIGYQYVIISVGEVNRKNEQPIITALTPESAYEAAIKYCLENLI